VRLVFVFEDAPEFARKLPEKEWAGERDPERIAQMLNESAEVVRDAVKSRVEAGRDMDLHYDHPILMLQHMIWHEGYHHGQIKLALKLAGRPISDKEAGPVTWLGMDAQEVRSLCPEIAGMGEPKSAPPTTAGKPFAKNKTAKSRPPSEKTGAQEHTARLFGLGF